MLVYSSFVFCVFGCSFVSCIVYIVKSIKHLTIETREINSLKYTITFHLINSI